MIEVLPTDAVLLDEDLDRRLAQDAVVTVPLFDADEVAALLAGYEELAPRGESGMQIDYLREDRDLVRVLSDFVEPFWTRRFAEVFTGHRPIATSFLVKHPGEDSALFLHRDLPTNDERFHRCYTVWVPLVDVRKDDPRGTLHILPGSERVPTGTAGAGTPVLTQPYFPSLEEHLSPVEVPAGTALVFDARMLHASPPNGSDESRPAVACLLARSSAPLVHVHPTGRRHRQLYEVDRDFFIDHHPLEIRDNGIPPGYRVIDEYDEDLSFGSESFRGLLADDAVPVAGVALPPDLTGDVPVSELKRYPVLPGRFVSVPTRDLAIDPGGVEPAPCGTTRGGLEVTAGSGATRIFTVKRPWRFRGELGRHVRAVLRWARAVRGTAIVLDPGARATIAPTQGDVLEELVVLECPQVKCGIRTAATASNPELGDRLDLSSGGSATLWNDGPGPFVLVLLRHGR